MIGYKFNLNTDVIITENNSQKISLIKFSQLSKHKDILHFITTRHGGFSKSPFSSFNLASHVGDKQDDVIKNRELLASYLGISSNSFFYTNQEHGDKVFLINNQNTKKRNIVSSNTIPTSDAMVTADKNRCLLIFVADCVPVLLYDYNKKVIGVVHAGWKGTVSLISQKTVCLMQKHYGCKPQDILCAIGPSIGPCCYEVGKDVIDLSLIHI